MNGAMPRAVPPPDEVRDKMVEIFQRPEFQRSRGPLQKALDGILKHLSGLIPGSAPAAGGGWGGPIWTALGWVVLTLLVIGLLVVAVVIVRGWRPVRRRSVPEVEVSVEEHRSSREWRSDAERHEAEGNWKEAIRCRYRELVVTLVDLRCATEFAGRTTGELRVDIDERLQAMSSEFSEATELFELAWYADQPTGSADNARFRALAAEIVAAAERTVQPVAGGGRSSGGGDGERTAAPMLRGGRR